MTENLIEGEPASEKVLRLSTNRLVDVVCKRQFGRSYATSEKSDLAKNIEQMGEIFYNNVDPLTITFFEYAEPKQSGMSYELWGGKLPKPNMKKEFWDNGYPDNYLYHFLFGNYKKDPQFNLRLKYHESTGIGGCGMNNFMGLGIFKNSAALKDISFGGLYENFGLELHKDITVSVQDSVAEEVEVVKALSNPAWRRSK